MINKTIKQLKIETDKFTDEYQRFDYLYEKYIDFRSMIDDIERVFQINIRDTLMFVEIFYDDVNEYYSFEHDKRHNINDDINTYFYTIPPIIRVRTINGILGNDGNHRLNTLKHHNTIKVPVILVTINTY